MSQQFLGEIRLFPFSFAPKGWALCQGQTLSIQQNAALFSLLGTIYGGNGSQNFQLPNLQGRTPIGVGPQNVPGMLSGVENVTLGVAQIPTHTHTLMASPGAANLNVPAAVNALGTGCQCYAGASGLQPMNAAALGGQAALPHNNMQPSLVLSYCIALVGIFPSRH